MRETEESLRFRKYGILNIRSGKVVVIDSRYASSLDGLENRSSMFDTLDRYELIQGNSGVYFAIPSDAKLYKTSDGIGFDLGVDVDGEFVDNVHSEEILMIADQGNIKISDEFEEFATVVDLQNGLYTCRYDGIEKTLAGLIGRFLVYPFRENQFPEELGTTLKARIPEYCEYLDKRDEKMFGLIIARLKDIVERLKKEQDSKS